MKDLDALILAERGEQPDQAAIRSLLRQGLVEIDNIVTLDSREARVLRIIRVTVKGEWFLDEGLRDRFRVTMTARK